jgi:CRP/FNR family transcriptional regulator
MNAVQMGSAEALMIIRQGTSLERVARILWSLASKLSASTAVPAGTPIRVPLTQRQIAEATGLTAIHVNRVVSGLREQRVVDFHDGMMVVDDPRKLAALANAYPDSAPPREDGAAPVQRRRKTSVRARSGRR